MATESNFQNEGEDHRDYSAETRSGIVISDNELSTHIQLHNIASHHGISLNDLLRIKLPELCKRYPEEKRKTRLPKKRKFLQIRGVSKNTITELTNIASHEYLDLVPFLKIRLPELCKEYPEHVRMTAKEK